MDRNPLGNSSRFYSNTQFYQDFFGQYFDARSADSGTYGFPLKTRPQGYEIFTPFVSVNRFIKGRVMYCLKTKCQYSYFQSNSTAPLVATGVSGTTFYRFVYGGVVDGVPNPDVLVGVGISVVGASLNGSTVGLELPAPWASDSNFQAAVSPSSKSDAKYILQLLQLRSPQLAVNPLNAREIVAGNLDLLYYSSDFGRGWRPISGNIAAVFPFTTGQQCRALLLVPIDGGRSPSAILAGTALGVAVSFSDCPGSWFPAPFGFPAIVKDLKYDDRADSVFAATAGRSIFRLRSAAASLAAFRRTTACGQVPPSPGPSSKLSELALAAIVIGSIVGATLLVFGVRSFMRWRQSERGEALLDDEASRSGPTSYY